MDRYLNEEINEGEDDANNLLENYAQQPINEDTDDRGSLLSSVKDKYSIIWGIMFLYGVSALLPWNIFITANDYFVNEKLNTTESFNSTYRTNFTFITGIVGQTTNVIVIFLCTFVPIRGNLQKKIPYTIFVVSILIFLQVIFAIIDSSDWPLGFFIICCASVVILYISTGIMNSCIFYTGSIFPMEYTNAIITGTNCSGLFTALCSVISKATTSNLRLAAIVYFLASFFILLVALGGYFVMHRLEFYKYWYNIYLENKRKAVEQNQDNKTTGKVPYKKIFSKVIIFCFCFLFQINLNFCIGIYF
jgi:solute carrier family 29 (equilibrative nucleoside transporter), member 1/2/3